ncbi:long-chain-fatty-acid--CoA ligase [Sphingomonas sanxanigenens]|uniref:AMP-binding protein n=1 Tax=Sphingomonas sanxanigenens DSM 19645 = NX02 TaxID=1123269 RepID=W0A7U4_9SPHN|nr:long-chain-fatty-acid--CoA ligase [Sphingomonas sanxanigenens]AHE53979.1 AMP-binding protein [Sphingomonas sanxanigenens DSM 19645 = NX02]
MPLRFAEPATDAYHFPLTIRHLLDGVVTRSGEQQILYRDESSYSYRAFVQRLSRLADMLASAGATPGMTVAVMDWDSHRYLEAYFAIPMMGAVLQTVNVRLPPPQIAYTLQHARAEILLVHRDFFPIVEAILPALPDVKAVIAILDGADADLPPWAIGEYETLSAAASPDYPFEDFDENAVATTFYTTGTTGNPKGVCFTHRQLVLHTLAAAGPFGASRAAPCLGVGDVYMPLTPMFHVHAWGVPYVATMLGLKQVYPGRYEPAMICRLRAEHQVTYSHCVPTILEMVLQAARETGADLSGWRMTIGGSALSKALCAAARNVGMDVGAGYGMSETAPMVLMAARRDPDLAGDEDATIHTLTASGVPLSLVEVRIVDDAMRDLPHDGETRGELVIRTPWLTPCYTGDRAASETLWRGGWLHTQDIATIDPQGQVRIRDRLKDVIKTGGEWIDSIQLEELVATADGIAEASVVAVPDTKWGERPLAVVVPKPGAVPTLATLNQPVDAAIAEGAITRYARLERFEIVDQLPRTSVGKIDKKQLRARFGEAPPELCRQAG